MQDMLMDLVIQLMAISNESLFRKPLNVQNVRMN